MGQLKGINLAIEDMSPRDLEAYNIYEGKKVKLAFEGNITVEGEVITGIRNLQGKIILITFKNCLVTYKNEVLFEPNWDLYHLAVGKKVVAAFAGPADNDSFDLINHKLSEKTPNKTNLTEIARNNVYQKVSESRHSSKKELNKIFSKIKKEYKTDWLLLNEFLEIVKEKKLLHLVDSCQALLKEFQEQHPSSAHLVDIS